MIVSIDALNRDDACRGLASLERELFGRGAWSEGMVREELEAPARTYVVDVEGLDASTIRGYAGFWYDGDDAELMTLGVGRAYQRQGIAAAMLRRLIAEARGQGARRMLLEVRVDNGPALRLYERFGFNCLGIRKRYYQPENVDAYTMSLDFEPRASGGVDGGAQDRETVGTTIPAGPRKSPCRSNGASFSSEHGAGHLDGGPDIGCEARRARDE